MARPILALDLLSFLESEPYPLRPIISPPRLRAAGREVHGATMVVLYCQKGLRSAWRQIRKGQRANVDPKDQVSPFPTMMIGLRGRAMSKVGGVEKILEAGPMVFVPAGTLHEAWNPFDEPAEFIILMFSDGA